MARRKPGEKRRPPIPLPHSHHHKQRYSLTTAFTLLIPNRSREGLHHQVLQRRLMQVLVCVHVLQGHVLLLVQVVTEHPPSPAIHRQVPAHPITWSLNHPPAPHPPLRPAPSLSSQRRHCVRGGEARGGRVPLYHRLVWPVEAHVEGPVVQDSPMQGADRVRALLNCDVADDPAGWEDGMLH